jgi:hypothetical protein
VSFQEIFTAMQQNASVAFNVILLFAVAWLYKDARQREREHLQTVLTIAPLSQRLAETVIVAERLMQRVSGKE